MTDTWLQELRDTPDEHYRYCAIPSNGLEDCILVPRHCQHQRMAALWFVRKHEPAGSFTIELQDEEGHSLDWWEFTNYGALKLRATLKGRTI